MDVNTFREGLRERVDRYRGVVNEAEQRRLQAIADLERATKALKSAEALLEYETNLDAVVSENQEKLPFNTATADHNAAADESTDRSLSGNDAQDAQSENVDGADGPNKAEFFRMVIRQRAQKGVMPVEIYRAFQSEGIAINRNYVYSLLQRAKDRGQVKERRGRYFPTEDALVSNDAH